MAARITLKKKRDKPIRQHHPWIFSGAIQGIEGDVLDGSVADVVSNDGEFLARGYVNRKSQIVVRLLTWDEGEAIDDAFWRSRLQRAIGARPPEAQATRLVNAESDGLPGLIVDRYGDWLIVQVLTLGIERSKDRWLDVLVDVISDRFKNEGIYERSDVRVREKEGLSRFSTVLHGAEPPDEVEIIERDRAGGALRFLVDVKRGHKTGFYLDQSENRRKVAAYCENADVLNLFSYTGGFGVHALAAGARSVTNVDSSAKVLALAKRNFALNGFDLRDEHFVEDDVFDFLRQCREQKRFFDVIVADPPRFVHSPSQVRRASRAYKDLSLVAMQILNTRGTLATFSCSGLVSAELFQKFVFAASIDAGRDAQIIEKLSQPSDHPILLTFPEAEYLKGLVCLVA